MIDQTTLLKDLVKLRDKLLKDLEELDSIIETLEIMADEKLMKSIERGLRDVEEGNVVDFEELIKETED